MFQQLPTVITEIISDLNKLYLLAKYNGEKGDISVFLDCNGQGSQKRIFYDFMIIFPIFLCFFFFNIFFNAFL